MKTEQNFPGLEAVLEDYPSGLAIVGRKFIQHNLRWANGDEEKPQFKFAYVMLPTVCNQRCME